MTKNKEKYLDIAKLEQNKCYNISFVASATMLGRKHSEKTKEKISKIAKERYKNGFIPWGRGRKFTKEHCKKISETRIALKIIPSLEQRKNKVK